MSENTRTTLVVAAIGAAGAIGAALIPILMADKSPPAPQPPASAITASPSTTESAAPVIPAPATKGGRAPGPVTKGGRAPDTVAKSAPAPDAVTKSAAGKAAMPPALTKAATKAAIAADEVRLQGRWMVVEEQARGKEFRPEDLAEMRPTWIFHDDNLVLRHRVDGKMVEQNHGTFKLRRGGGRKTLDYVAETEGRHVEFYGIYDFDGDFLKVCFQIRRGQSDAPPGAAPTRSRPGPAGSTSSSRSSGIEPSRARAVPHAHSKRSACVPVRPRMSSSAVVL